MNHLVALILVKTCKEHRQYDMLDDYGINLA